MSGGTPAADSAAAADFVLEAVAGTARTAGAAGGDLSTAGPLLTPFALLPLCVGW